MRFATILFAILFGVVLTYSASDAKPEDSTAFEKGVEGTEIVLVVMPKGDAVKGRKSFLRMSCNSCHRVLNDRAMPAPIEKSGPDLAYKQTNSSSGYEITSILSPSHIVAFENRINYQRTSSMPDLTESMTVRELIDILAYLRSTKPK